MHPSTRVFIAFRQTAEEKGYKLLFTPPYTLEFNPVEMIFGIIKNRFLQRKVCANVQQLGLMCQLWYAIKLGQ